jgi:hypothetical protein
MQNDALSDGNKVINYLCTEDQFVNFRVIESPLKYENVDKKTSVIFKIARIDSIMSFPNESLCMRDQHVAELQKAFA